MKCLVLFSSCHQTPSTTNEQRRKDKREQISHLARAQCIIKDNSRTKKPPKMQNDFPSPFLQRMKQQNICWAIQKERKIYIKIFQVYSTHTHPKENQKPGDK